MYDERLQFMSREDALNLDEALLSGDVSSAWMVWSSAAEKALADAFRFAGRPVPARGLVLGRSMARMRTVRIGGPIVRSVRRSAASGGDVDDVSLYRDSSAAPVLDLRRNLRAVLNLLDAIVRWGASLTRDVELSHLWDSVVRLGSLGSVHVQDYDVARVCGVGESRRLVAELHGRVSAFVRCLVAYRRSAGITAWRNWFGKILWFILISGCELIWFHLLPSCSVIVLLLLGVLVFLLILLGLTKNSARRGFPTFVVLGKGRPALMNSMVSVLVGCRIWMSFSCRL